MKSVMQVAKRKLSALALAVVAVVMSAASVLGFDGTTVMSDNTALFYDLGEFVQKAATGPAAYAFLVVGICVGGYMIWNSKIVQALGVFTALICIIKFNSLLMTLGYTFS